MALSIKQENRWKVGEEHQFHLVGTDIDPHTIELQDDRADWEKVSQFQVFDGGKSLHFSSHPKNVHLRHPHKHHGTSDLTVIVTNRDTSQAKLEINGNYES